MSIRFHRLFRRDDLAGATGSRMACAVGDRRSPLGADPLRRVQTGSDAAEPRGARPIITFQQH